MKTNKPNRQSSRMEKEFNQSNQILRENESIHMKRHDWVDWHASLPTTTVIPNPSWSERAKGL